MRAIFRQEFIRYAQSKAFFWLRAGAFALPLILSAAGMSEARTPDQEGYVLFVTTFLSLIAVVLFMGPALLAPVIAEERKNNRLDVLRSAPVGNWGIVLGKWSARVASLGAVVLAVMPLAATSLLFGGVAPGQFLDGAAITLTTLFWVTACAFWIGSIVRDPSSAARIGIGSVLLFGGVTALGLGAGEIYREVTGSSSLAVSVTGNLVAFLNPFVVFVNVFEPVPMSFAVLKTTGLTPLVFYAVASSVAGAGFLVLAQRAIGREPRAASGKRRLRWRFSGSRSTLAKIWVLDAHPLVWLDDMLSGRGKGGLARKAFFLVVVVGGEILFASLYSTIRDRRFRPGEILLLHAFASGIALLLAFVSVASVGATVFHRDSEARSLEILHAAPLSTRSMVMERMTVVLRMGGVYWFLSVLHVVFGWAAGDLPFWVLPMYIVYSGILVVTLAIFAAAVSLHRDSARKSVLWVFGTMVAFTVVLPIFLGLVMAGGNVEEVGVLIMLGHHPYLIAMDPFILAGMDHWSQDMEWLFTPLIYLAQYALAAHFMWKDIFKQYARRRAANWGMR